MKYTKGILLTGLVFSFVGITLPMNDGKKPKSTTGKAAAHHKPAALSPAVLNFINRTNAKPAPRANAVSSHGAAARPVNPRPLPAPAPTERPLASVVQQIRQNGNPVNPAAQALLLQARLKAAAHQHQPAPGPNAGKQEKAPECSICKDDLTDANRHTLSCHHVCCVDCLNQMIDIAINEKSTANLRCPDRSCGRRKLDDTDIRIITNDPEKIQAINLILLHEVLATDKNAKQCPGKDCTNIFINPDNRAVTVRCPACRESYCSQCLHNHTQQITCEQSAEQRALDAKNGDQANEAWKKQNTKPCPRCKADIEKNGGCLHMTCNKCMHQFCWLCLKNYGENFAAGECVGGCPRPQ